MEIGIFQLLPVPEALSDREVIEQALWEVDCAEAGGFGSVWITEHHLSSFGLVGAPSVYAAAVAQRTQRVRIGYAIAVLPLHHPLRLAEEIAWVGHLSRGRLLVGVGPGFSPYEFGAFGVPLAERHARLEEGAAILRAALAGEPFSYAGRFWSVPPVTLRPRPFQGCPPPFLRASSSVESLQAAARDGVPVMFGLAATAQIAERIAAYRACAADLGRPAAEIDRQVAEFRVLRRVVLAAGDAGGDDALADARQALRWEARTARRVHRAAGDRVAGDAGDGGDGHDGHETGERGGAAKLADGSDPHHEAGAADAAGATDAADAPEVVGGCVGTPRTVLRELAALRALGIRHVIAWLNFGDLPFAKVRRSMELLRDEVLPALADEEPPEPAAMQLQASLAGAGRLQGSASESSSA
jgi:alkanesulfonate monooxygenase SsuD/methylene tetrahydromethanopterin reductase-like flavin-dependent oxidoreductase (luciferase family)